jgi:hypothetical protein
VTCLVEIACLIADFVGMIGAVENAIQDFTSMKINVSDVGKDAMNVITMETALVAGKELIWRMEFVLTV